MLNWNAAKLKNLTPTEIWCFVVARVFIGFGFGHTAGVLAPACDGNKHPIVLTPVRHGRAPILKSLEF